MSHLSHLFKCALGEYVDKESGDRWCHLCEDWIDLEHFDSECCSCPFMPSAFRMRSSPVIIALDVESAAEARGLITALGDSASFYKVGLELYTSAGMDFVRELKAQGHRVFVDLKFYDLSETVRRAVAQVARIGADFLSVHGSVAVMQAAAAGKRDGGHSGLKLLGVTVLTSFDESDLRQLGYPCSVSELVELRGRNAMEAGVEGIVCSPLEVSTVRSIAGAGAILVTPGVRSAGAATGDQKRVTTPAEAMARGADYLVIGRQVTRAADPRGEMLRILEEIQAGARPTERRSG